MTGRASAASALHSTRRPLAIGFTAAALLVFGVGGWAATTDISGAVIASGKLVADSNVKKVQHPTGGVVGELLAKDGDRVRQGDVVVRLDGTQARASLAIVTKALDEIEARRARLLAERDGADALAFPADLVARRGEPDVALAMASEQRLFELRRSAREGQKAQLGEQVEQLRQQIAGNGEQIAGKSKEIDWDEQELAGVRSLWKDKLVPFSRVTTLERDLARLQGERGALSASVAQAKGRIAEIRLKTLQVDEDLRTEVGKELAEIRARKAELVERRVAAEDQLKRIDLVAPQDGKVFQRSVHTVGGVVQAGEPVMLIVPDDESLVVEAKVPAHDIDQVHVGQRAVLHFSAFDQRTTPELDGEVVNVAADSAQDEKTGGEPYYLVRVRVRDGELDRLGDLALRAGMPVELFIQTVPRTVASFLVKPLGDQLERAFRGR